MDQFRLPAITMIAGATHPIDFQITDYYCMSVDPEEVVGHLSVTPYINLTNAPLFSITATGLDEDGVMRFVIDSSKTVSLSGKFIYQLHLTNGTESEIYEGYLTILANRNKSAFSGGD